MKKLVLISISLCLEVGQKNFKTISIAGQTRSYRQIRYYRFSLQSFQENVLKFIFYLELGPSNTCFQQLSCQQQFQSKQNMFTRTREITPSHQYRSVKYKVIQDSNAPLLPTSDFQTVQVKQMSRTFHTSWGRGSRYSMRKDERRELLTAEMPEDAANDTKISYMNTLDKLFLSSERRPNSSRKDSKMSTLRVSLPNIVDCEPSLFTSLEPMSQPIDFIERGVETLRKEMAAHKMQISQLHHNIQAIKTSITCQLDETRKQGERQVERLSKLLKADSVEFQESQLRFRRQCGELRKGDDNLRRNFQAVKQRESCLQTEIFSSRPFELVRNQQLHQQFPQEYF